jgi:ATP-dependent protease ClpP protease subunit
MKHFALVFALLFGCASTPKPAPATPTPDLSDLLWLLSGDTPIKESPPCLVNGCTYDIHAEIDEEMSTDFVKWMDSAKSAGASMVNISINSPGGDVEAGYVMARKMEAFDKAGIKTACTVDGNAASMAFSILQSCTYRYMTGRSTLMTHQEKVGTKAGRAMSESQLRSMADMVKADNYAAAIHCVRRMKISVEEFLAKTDNKDWWMASDEAIKVGAVDQIVKF